MIMRFFLTCFLTFLFSLSISYSQCDLSGQYVSEIQTFIDVDMHWADRDPLVTRVNFYVNVNLDSGWVHLSLTVGGFPQEQFTFNRCESYIADTCICYLFPESLLGTITFTASEIKVFYPDLYTMRYKLTDQ